MSVVSVGWLSFWAFDLQDGLPRYYRPQALPADPPKFATYELEEKLWSLSEKLVQKYL